MPTFLADLNQEMLCLYSLLCTAEASLQTPEKDMKLFTKAQHNCSLRIHGQVEWRRNLSTSNKSIEEVKDDNKKANIIMWQ